MTAVNWLFPPLSPTLDFPCMLSNLNCAVIAYVAFLSSSFLQKNLISLLLPVVEFAATHCGRNNTKWRVNKRKGAEWLGAPNAKNCMRRDNALVLHFITFLNEAIAKSVSFLVVQSRLSVVRLPISSLWSGLSYSTTVRRRERKSRRGSRETDATWVMKKKSKAMLMPGCSGVDWLWFLGASKVNVALGNVLLGKRGVSVWSKL